MSDIENAKQILASGNYTCVLCKDNEVHTSNERGVKPLVAWYESGHKFNGFSAADKVVGRGAAFLYVLLGVNSIYADVISSPALELLKNHKIRVEYGTEVEHIINRRGDGICPFELAVMDINNADAAYLIIQNKIKKILSTHN